MTWTYATANRFKWTKKKKKKTIQLASS